MTAYLYSIVEIYLESFAKLHKTNNIVIPAQAGMT